MSEHSPYTGNVNEYLNMNSNLVLDENEYLLPTPNEYLFADDKSETNNNENIYQTIDDFQTVHLNDKSAKINNLVDKSSIESKSSAVNEDPSTGEGHYVADPTSSDTMRKIQRNQIVVELIETEKQYLKDVRVIVEDLLYPVLRKNLEEEVNAKKIFSNIEDILEFTSKFSEDLNQLIVIDENGKKSIIENENTNVATVFLQHMSCLEAVYKIYCRNYDESVMQIENLKNKGTFNSAFSDILQNVRKKAAVFTLDSFLIKPVQRVLKYPLLVDNVMKKCLIEEGQFCYDVARCSKRIHDVANIINEERRKKELVRHYKEQNSIDIKISDKLRKLSFGTVKKKYSRAAQSIRKAAGMIDVDHDDPIFVTVENRFKQVDNKVKQFDHNIDDFLCKLRDVLHNHANLSASINRFLDDNSVDLYVQSSAKISEHIFRQFHTKVQLDVISPLVMLTQMYKSPWKLIEKRNDKLLDYEVSMRGDNNQVIQANKNDYLALNNQLCDELPKLCNMSINLLNKCIKIFNNHHYDFVQLCIKELAQFRYKFSNHPLQNHNMNYNNTVESIYKIMQNYRARSSLVENELAKYSFIPKSFTIESPMSQRRKSIANQKDTFNQTIEMKEQLMMKYDVINLRVATTNYNDGIINCQPGNLFAVVSVKNKEKLLIDNGVLQTVLPSNILRHFDPEYDFKSTKEQHSPKFYKNFHNDNKVYGPVAYGAHDLNQDVGVYGQYKQENNNNSNNLNASNKGQTKQKSKFIKTGIYGQTSQSSTTGSGDLANLNISFDEYEILDNATISTFKKPSNSLSEIASSNHLKTIYRAEYSFQASNKLELSVVEGERVQVVCCHDIEGNTEWWLVKTIEGSKQGYVPANYLALVT